MKKSKVILLILLSALFSCTKKEQTRTSGIDTIDNITYFDVTYYTYGFSFSGAKLVSTNLNPGPDITVIVNVDNVTPRLTLLTNNLNPSFFKAGEYPDEASAKTAFDNLKTISPTQFVDLADPILPNQVWIYKSGSGKYTKFRIISTVDETRNSLPYGECTFQWVYQPDGSTTFP